MKDPTAYQQEIAAKLGIDISDDSYRVAAARIQEVVGPAVSAQAKTRPVRPDQIALAKGFGLSVAEDSSQVAAAKIQDRREQINRELAREMDLKPGDRVVHKTGGAREHIVRKVAENGAALFEDGQRAWPMDLRIVHNDSFS